VVIWQFERVIRQGNSAVLLYCSDTGWLMENLENATTNNIATSVASPELCTCIERIREAATWAHLSPRCRPHGKNPGVRQIERISSMTNAHSIHQSHKLYLNTYLNGTIYRPFLVNILVHAFLVSILRHLLLSVLFLVSLFWTFGAVRS
jgi:hypothetical protein